jgi:hypothetical protein
MKLYWGILTIMLFSGCATFPVDDSEDCLSFVGENSDDCVLEVDDKLDDDYPRFVPSSVEQQKCHLTVKATPPDSLITVMNIKSVYSPAIPLECGKYNILVEKQGYITYRRWVTVDHQNTEFQVILKQPSPEERRQVEQEFSKILESVLLREGYLDSVDADESVVQHSAQYRGFSADLGKIEQSDLKGIKTVTGKGIQDFHIPPKLKSDTELIALILLSESMNDDERQSWLSLTEIMTQEQIEKLRDIQREEWRKLIEIKAKSAR